MKSPVTFMHSRRPASHVAAVLLATLVASLLAACGQPTAEPGPNGTTAPPSTEPRYGGNLIIGTIGEPVLLNDAYSQDTASGAVTELVFAGLVTYDEHLEPKPLLAMALPEVSPDGLVWTFHLRPGVQFHDGVELTARDVVFTYQVFKHPDYTGPRAGSFRALSQVEAVDDETVRFTLTEPDATFMSTMDYGILPQHLLADVPIAELGDYRAFNEHPIGAGPFKFGSWARGQNLVLEAFDDYFGGRPYLDRITFRFVANQSTAVLLLETGEIDDMIVPITEVRTVEQIPHVVLHSTLELRYDFIGWNLRNPLFADRRVRQALAHAIDRQEIVDTLLEGHAEIANAPTSPLMAWAYTDDVPKFPYDPERARALLAEAGWSLGSDGILQKDGNRFAFTILSNDGNVVRRDLGVIAQQYLRAVGIEVSVVQLEWGAFLDRIQPPRNDFDAFILAWAMGTDPDPSPIWHSREIAQGLNNIGFSNARVDELADRSVRLLARDERAAVLKDIWRVIAEEQPYVFLFYPQQFIALRDDVRGFVHHPRIETYGAEKWWLDR